MADPNIKQFRVPPSEMPPINSITQGYSVRYRIISEDRNRNSHWSPVYLIEPNYTFIPGQIGYSANSNVVNIDWDAVTILKDISSTTSINNKELSSDLATLTTDGAHYMSVGDWVTVTGVDSIFNGIYQISAVTSNTFSYYKNNGNIASTLVNPEGTYKKNSLIRRALDYDVWVRWDRNDGGDWLYKERIESTSLSFPVPDIYTINGAVQPSAPNRFSAEIYLRGYPVERGDGVPLDPSSPFLKVYQVLNETI